MLRLDQGEDEKCTVERRRKKRDERCVKDGEHAYIGRRSKKKGRR